MPSFPHRRFLAPHLGVLLRLDALLLLPSRQPSIFATWCRCTLVDSLLTTTSLAIWAIAVDCSPTTTRKRFSTGTSTLSFVSLLAQEKKSGKTANERLLGMDDRATYSPLLLLESHRWGQAMVYALVV